MAGQNDMVSMPAEQLNPAQQEVINLLGKSSEPIAWDPTLAADLRDELAEATDDLFGRVGDDKIWISKHGLSGLHGCETHHLATEGKFEWTVQNVRGTIAHKAIELSIHWDGEAYPLTLVREAVARVGNSDHGAARFIEGLGDADLAELRGECTDLVTKFTESFPRLKAEWTPVTESKSTYTLAEGKVVLSGKVDLTLGRIRNMEPAKVIIDLKSGRRHKNHVDDLRFYALLETLKLGVPPRKVASYYLDEARAQVEEVTEAGLRAALARTIDGIHKAVELKEGRPPNVQPGPPCRWCPVSDDCPAGMAFLSDQDEPDF
jgi:CRISPR/Cas system-associated exonuclease Cas4 (RecB family)